MSSFTSALYSKNIVLANGSRTTIQGISTVTITPTFSLSYFFIYLVSLSTYYQ